MKKIKLLLVCLTICLGVLVSCTDKDPIANQIKTEKSTSLRTTLNEMKKINGIGGKYSKIKDQDFCFEFVYPLNLSYNNGTSITVTSLEGLMEILSNENENVYILSIGFPFQVQKEGAVTTINNEDEFNVLIQSCNFYTVDESVYAFDCYQIVYPFSIINQNNQTVSFANETELYTLFASPEAESENYFVDFVYPVSLAQNGQITVVTNLYQMYELLDTCESANSCICTLEYAPVCVQTPNGIEEFGNLCFALCEGYTQNDVVACTSTSCGIENLTLGLFNCNPLNGTFSVNIDFDTSISPSSQFEVINSGNQIVGTYPISSLPVTANFYSGLPAGTLDLITVRLVGVDDCFVDGYYNVPNCNNLNSNFLTVLGSCFTIQYPVQVQSQGAVYTVNTDQALLAHFDPVNTPLPLLTYPIQVLFTDDVNFTTVTNAADFQVLITGNCN